MQQIVAASENPVRTWERLQPTAAEQHPVATNGPLADSAKKPKILVVSPVVEDREFLRPIFESACWAVWEVGSCREAFKFLTYDRPAVIICEWDLPDGSWRDVLSMIAPLPDSPTLLVTSGEVEDSRWAEVLNLGAYDMLVKPFDREEVTRVTGLACLRRDRKHPEPEAGSDSHLPDQVVRS